MAYSFVENVLVPLYTSIVLLYLSLRFLQASVLRQPRSISTFASLLAKYSASVAGSVPRVTTDQQLARYESANEEAEQPIDMSGKYKLISLENFDAFLAVQGVQWALRKAACKARPVHNIIHRGNVLTIKIEGIIFTETTYIINGPPVKIDIRGRIFMDRVAYLENGKGIRGTKEAVTENYDVFIDRVLSDDKQQILLTSRAVFRDGRESIESRQVFQRIE